MNYAIEFRPAARRDLAKLPRQMQRRISAKIDALAADPRPANCIKIAGIANSFRIRVGDYRVVYEIHDDRRLVIVFIVAHRRESYRGL
jgi:mRNA interferase RelE/StbE